MSYTNYYPGGWKDWPDVSTPITSAALTHMESGITAAGGGGATGSGEDTLNVIAASGATQTLDISTGATQDVTLTANCTLTFANPPAGAGAWYMTILLRQDATGSRTVTWPAITWLGTGIAPVLQTAPSAVDSVVVFTDDDGSHWFGVAQTSASGLRAGTSFPGSPADGDLFYRTDTRILFEYNSTVSRWLSLDRKYLTIANGRFLNQSGNTGVAGWAPIFEDTFVESVQVGFHISATNDGSNFWTATLYVDQANVTATQVTVQSTSADPASSCVVHGSAIGNVYASATYKAFELDLTKTGTPSIVDLYVTVVVRSAG